MTVLNDSFSNDSYALEEIMSFMDLNNLTTLPDLTPYLDVIKILYNLAGENGRMVLNNNELTQLRKESIEKQTIADEAYKNYTKTKEAEKNLKSTMTAEDYQAIYDAYKDVSEFDYDKFLALGSQNARKEYLESLSQ